MKLAAKLTLGLLASLSMTAAMAQTAPVKPTPPQAPHHGPGPEQKDLTRAEVLAMAGERFDRADTNKDGILTKDERRAAHKKMRDRRGPPPGDFDGPPPGGPHGDHKGPPPPRDGGPADKGGPAPQR